MSAKAASISVGKVDIQNDQIEPYLNIVEKLGSLLQAGGFNGVEIAGFSKLLGQDTSQRRIILNDQNGPFR